MLPDFPRIKANWSKVFIRHVAELSKRDAFIAQIKVHRHFEGNRLSTKTAEGDVDSSQYQLMSSQLSIPNREIIEKGPKAFIEHLNKMAEDLSKQQSKLLFEKMNEAIAKTGNDVDAKGQPISPELLFKVLEKIDIEFDDEGKPYMPSLVTSPEQWEKLKEKIPEWEANTEYNRQFNELMERKRQEWHDRESHRKLVD